MTDPRYLLDSNICIYILDGAPAKVRDRLERCAPGEVVTSSIAYGEVLRGFERRPKNDKSAAEHLFGVIAPLPFGVAEAREYARLPFKRASFDRLIAAHALSLGLCLVTNNERHFQDIDGLRLENWTQ